MLARARANYPAIEFVQGDASNFALPEPVDAILSNAALHWMLRPDEVITTLMGNFIAALILVYVTTGPLKDPSGSGQQSSSRPLKAAYRISDSLGVSPVIVTIALVVGVGMWLLVNRTAFGVLASLAGLVPALLAHRDKPALTGEASRPLPPTCTATS